MARPIEILYRLNEVMNVISITTLTKVIYLTLLSTIFWKENRTSI